jgi:hypothetical protein
LSLPMKGSSKRKCPGCSEFYLPDRRNLWHQRYRSNPACRKLSKAESQRRWLQKPDNQNYLPRGPENNRRVQEWRKRNRSVLRHHRHRASRLWHLAFALSCFGRSKQAEIACTKLLRSLGLAVKHDPVHSSIIPRSTKKDFTISSLVK